MSSVGIHGVGVCATGLPQWSHAQEVLLGRADCVTASLGRLDTPSLPATERRRVNATSRLAIHAAMQAVVHLQVSDRARLASVFASADGDGAVLASTLEALAQDPPTMSPTLFHNSVFNAPAGYWSIASGARQPSITVSAGVASFAAGLLEACIQVVIANSAVLYIAVDMPFPEALRTFDANGDAFACALLLAPSSTGPSLWGEVDGWNRAAISAPPSELPSALASRFRGNSAAAALPLLAAIAAHKSTAIALPYLDDAYLHLAYTA